MVKLSQPKVDQYIDWLQRNDCSGSHGCIYDDNDQYDYIDWWLYEAAPDYKVWSEDDSKEWDLKEPEALCDFITTECE